MERGHEIKVLDHGYVRLVDYMGSDEAIVEAARMSTGRGFISWDAYKRCKKCGHATSMDRETCNGVLPSKTPTIFCCHTEFDKFPRGDLGLLETMYKNKHSTPFEFGELHIEVQAPIMVFREWHRHRTQAYSEFSARYSQMPDLHYAPEPSRIQKQSATNRQGSGEAFDQDYAQHVIDVLKGEQGLVYGNYDNLVKAGVAKEVARINTPVARYSKMRAKTDLRNWLGFLILRMAPAAQYEIRQYANAVAEIVKALWPRTYGLFEEHDFRGTHLSRHEVKALREVLGKKDDSLLQLLGSEKAVEELFGKLGVRR